VRPDVVVVGAGPAGSATAARLAGAGWRVVLVDREHFPRRKPCGECLNPAAVADLARLGALDRVRALSPRELTGWRIESDGAGFDGRFPAGRPGLALPREELDAALVDHAVAAGAELRTGVHVTDLARSGGRITGVVTGGATIPARIVVGADGLRSVVVRRLGLVRSPPRLRKIALTAHLRGGDVPGTAGALRVRGTRCLGVAGVGAGLVNATLVLRGDGADAIRGDPAGFFDAELRAWGVRGERVDRVLATGPFDVPVRGVVADGALLVGDAAGYFDPFTGQGIHRALRGAELAAGAVDRALREGGGGTAALREYARAARRAFAGGEALQHAIEAVVSRPRLLRAVLPVLKMTPLGDGIVRLAGDCRDAGAHPGEG
jgi:menaquinone-9 beta-reductase